MPEKLKVPCPSCTFRGPVWLDDTKTCIYCDTTWRLDDDEIWGVVPWESWLENGMILRDELPDLCGKAIGVV